MQSLVPGVPGHILLRPWICKAGEDHYCVAILANVNCVLLALIKSLFIGLEYGICILES